MPIYKCPCGFKHTCAYIELPCPHYCTGCGAPCIAPTIGTANTFTSADLHAVLQAEEAAFVQATRERRAKLLDSVSYTGPLDRAVSRDLDVLLEFATLVRTDEAWLRGEPDRPEHADAERHLPLLRDVQRRIALFVNELRPLLGHAPLPPEELEART
jgi:hypothetical protein